MAVQEEKLYFFNLHMATGFHSANIFGLTSRLTESGKADRHKDHQVIPAAVGTSRSHQVSVVQRESHGEGVTVLMVKRSDDDLNLVDLPRSEPGMK